MPFTTLISAGEAAAHLGEPGWLFVDTRSVLGKPDAGHEAYRAQHIPGAVYADLETDLSGPIVLGRTGRHPLPERAALEVTLGRLGVGDGTPEGPLDADTPTLTGVLDAQGRYPPVGVGVDAAKPTPKGPLSKRPRSRTGDMAEPTQVVAYDEATGALAAARLWWLLRWAGHDAVAVLDGGFRHWLAEGLPVAGGDQQAASAQFRGRFRAEMMVDVAEVAEFVRHGGGVLLDARTADRFRGENETIDPVAGHVAGARSLPYPENLEPGGLFLPAARLRERFSALGVRLDQAITYCGSGVTAAHNVLAAAHAGLPPPRLYAGSWSEWIANPERPVERGG